MSTPANTQERNQRSAVETQSKVFSVAHFAAFWAAPDANLVAHVVTPDVLADWPGAREPVRGVDAYRKRIAEVLALVPDLKLSVAEHAAQGDVLFIRWIATGTGRFGPFELTGVDRIHLRNGLVAENLILFDTARFAAAVGATLPWA